MLIPIVILLPLLAPAPLSLLGLVEGLRLNIGPIR